jgi:hypothetical protein
MVGVMLTKYLSFIGFDFDQLDTFFQIERSQNMITYYADTMILYKALVNSIHI